MADETKVRTEETHDGQRLRIILDGGRGNVVDRAMATQLIHALEHETDGQHLKCITVEATGKDFSFGASVAEHAPDKAAELLEALHRAVEVLVTLDIPVIAAVRGHCLGGGLELVLPCQRIVASPTARLGMPEITLAMYAPAGSVLLPGRVGRVVAEDMLLTGRLMPAEEALSVRLVDILAEDPEKAAVEWFEKHLAPRSAMGVRFATRAARATMMPHLHGLLVTLERRFINELLLTEDAIEGMRAFAEKRDPVWVDA